MILLVDMDAFFASVEQAHHPHLRGKAVIVCGDPSRRGVVTAASYEARPSGVRAGMPLAEAKRLCPNAEYVEGNPRKYVEKSLELLEMFLEITPDVEPFSVDEAFLDLKRLPGRGQTLESATGIARELQQRIWDRHGLGASIGVAPNKLIAKMASGVKKPRGITALDEERFRGVFWPQGVQALWGVGPKMSEHLKALGIATVGALAHAPAPVMEQRFGVVGEHLIQAAWGRDRTRPGSDARPPRRSVAPSRVQARARARRPWRCPAPSGARSSSGPRPTAPARPAARTRRGTSPRPAW